MRARLVGPGEPRGDRNRGNIGQDRPSTWLTDIYANLGSHKDSYPKQASQPEPGATSRVDRR
jgi:hypothetical protein